MAYSSSLDLTHEHRCTTIQVSKVLKFHVPTQYLKHPVDRCESREPYNKRALRETERLSDHNLLEDPCLTEPT